MELNELLIDLFERITEHVHEAVDGLDVEALTTPPEPGTNPIGWLVWHLTRVQDHHIADILGEEQVWISGGWARRFGVAADAGNTGYGALVERRDGHPAGECRGPDRVLRGSGGTHPSAARDARRRAISTASSTSAGIRR